MRTLPAAVQECVLGSGALGLLKGEAKQLGNGRSLLEKSELFMMACSACNHSEVPLQLGKRGSGRFGVWKLVCSGCQAVDEMVVRCVVSTEATMDEHLVAMGVPTVFGVLSWF